jgi:flagellar biosynthesis protein FlhG
MAAQVQRATVFAVTSGKGGVGKSNVSVNLAIALAQSGKRVILIDADLGLANADVLCNIDVKSNLAHVVARQRELKDVMVDAPGGFKLICGASGLAKMADLSDFDRERLIRALGELETQCDIIIIDTGAGISPSVMSFTRAADHVLVVTTPEPTAITDAYAAIKVLVKAAEQEGSAHHDRRISLLVNQTLSPQEGAHVYERVSKVARQFLGAVVFDAGFVPKDDAVTTAVRGRKPFVLAAPRSPASLGMLQLASRLGGGNAQTQASGFFDRLGRWMFRT